TLDLEAHSEAAHPDRRDHLLHHGAREHPVRHTPRRELYFQCESSQVASRGPESGGCHLGIDVPPGSAGFASRTVPPGGIAIALGRKRLLERAARHADRSEYVLVHYLRKRPTASIHESLL